MWKHGKLKLGIRFGCNVPNKELTNRIFVIWQTLAADEIDIKTCKNKRKLKMSDLGVAKPRNNIKLLSCSNEWINDDDNSYNPASMGLQISLVEKFIHHNHNDDVACITGVCVVVIIFHRWCRILLSLTSQSSVFRCLLVTNAVVWVTGCKDR